MLPVNLESFSCFVSIIQLNGVIMSQFRTNDIIKSFACEIGFIESPAFLAVSFWKGEGQPNANAKSLRINLWHWISWFIVINCSFVHFLQYIFLFWWQNLKSHKMVKTYALDNGFNFYTFPNINLPVWSIHSDNQIGRECWRLSTPPQSCNYGFEMCRLNTSEDGDWIEMWS